MVNHTPKYTAEEYRILFDSIFKGRFELMSDYTKQSDGVIVKHLECGYVFKTDPLKAVDRKDIACHKCDKRYTYVIPYVNDLSVTNPEIVDLLADKEDAHRYKAHSTKKVGIRCPVCGGVYNQVLSKVTEKGFTCPFCGNKNGSYAERFMLNMFSQLDIDVKKEFSPKWAKPRRYDFMFEKDGNKYIIEIDGGWHYEDNNFSSKTASKQQESDKEKEELAIKNGYIVIRLNYNYKNNNRDEVLIDSINTSPLPEILELSKVDFSECSYNALHCTIVKDVADTWLNGVRSCQQIADLLHISVGTVKSHLQLASNCGLIDMSYDNIKKENRKYFSEVTHRKPLHDDDILDLWNNEIYNYSEIARKIGSNHKSVKQAIQRMCQNGRIPYSFEEANKIKDKANPKHVGKHPKKVLCVETGEIFIGYSEANKKYGSDLSNYFYTNGHKGSGKLPDGTHLTWQKIINQ